MAFLSISRILLKRISHTNSPLPICAFFCDLRQSVNASLPMEPPDPLLNNLKNSRSSGELFSIISNSSKAFDHRHSLEALKMIFEFHKTEKLTLTSDPTFEKLCVRLKYHSRNMEIYEIVETIKILNFVGVSVSSTIFQVFLQHIRSRINDLSMQQIIFFDYLLRKMDSNNLTSSLRLAMPLLFQIQLPNHLENSTPKQLADYLHFACIHNIPKKDITSLATHILMAENIDVMSAKSIIISLCRSNIDFSSQSVFIKLFFHVLQIISDNIYFLQFKDVNSILIHLKIKVINSKHELLYHQNFFNACAQYVIDKNIKFVDALSVANSLSRVAHTHTPLLRYISELILIEPELLENANYNDVFNYINALSNANFKPPDWDQIQIYLFENNLFEETKIELPWTKFALELASLDCYNDNLLKKIFNDEFLETYLSRNYSLLDKMQLLTLNQATSTIYKTFNGSLPKHIEEDAIKSLSNKEVDRFILPALEIALNGKEFFTPNVMLPTGFCIDFLILLDDKGNPTPISEVCDDLRSKAALNQFLMENKNRLLCIMYFHRGCYSINADRLRGIFALTLRILDGYGYNYLSISSKEWMALQPQERVPFLQREIFSTIEKRFVRQSN